MSSPTLLRHASLSEVKAMLGGASFFFACRLAGATSAFATQVLLARWMGADALGVYVYAFAWCVLLSVVSDLGLAGAATYRFIGQGIAQPRLIAGFTRRGTQLILGSGVMISAVGLLFLWRSADGSSGAQIVTTLIALSLVPVYAMFPWLSAIAQSFSWYALALLPSLAVRPILLLLAVTGMWICGYTLAPASVMSLHAVIIVLVIAGNATLLRRSLRRRFQPVQPKYETSTWLRTAIPLLFTGLLLKTFLELNLILAGQFLPSDELAILNAAFRLAFLIAWGIQGINMVNVPRSARLYAAGDTRALQRIIARGTQIQFWGSVIGLVGFVIAGRWLLSLFGAAFETGYDALIVLSISHVVVAGFGPAIHLLTVSGHERHCLVVFLCTLLSLITLHSILVPLFGMVGAALAVLITVTLQSLWANFIAMRWLHIKPSIMSFRSIAG